MKFKILLTSAFLIAVFAFFAYQKAPEKLPESSIRVGVFNGNGASPICVLETMEALKIDQGISPVEISASDIMTGKLDNLEALIFPGGSGSKELNSLGQLAADKVRAFARDNGKGIVGICAGGYLLSTTPTYPSLEVLPAPDIRAYYDRGRGLMSFNLNEKGKAIFPELKDNDSLFVQYYDGPIFEIPENSPIQVVGEIYSDIATHKGYPHDVTPGKPSFFTYEYGKGKIFVSVGHPEATAGLRWMVPRMARWVSNQRLIDYPKQVVRPEINDKEIFFYKDTKKAEKKHFWNLYSKDDAVVIDAMKQLHALRSRPSIRWSIGLLRHHSWEVRLAAAKYMVESEYTFAIPDMKAAYEAEKDPAHRAVMKKLYEKLLGIVSC